MKNILVTGAAGFIGCNFVRYMQNKYGKDIFIVSLDYLSYAGSVDNLKDIPNPDGHEFVMGNTCDQKLVEWILRFYDIDTIVNFAAETHVDRSIVDPEKFIVSNINCTFHLLEAARIAWRDTGYHGKRFHHISCYDAETRAYTSGGLKFYTELQVGDLVLSLNPKSNKIEWKPIEKIITQDYFGDMIRAKSSTSNFLVTPNHRMLIQQKKTKKLTFIEAEKLLTKTVSCLPRYYSWDGNIPTQFKSCLATSSSSAISIEDRIKSCMYLLGIFIGDGCVSPSTSVRENKTGLSRSAYLAQGRNSYGHFSSIGKVGTIKTSTSTCPRIFLDIPETDKSRKRCEKVLSDLEIPWHPHKGKAGTHLYFSSKPWATLFSSCGHGAKNKRIPEWALDAPMEYLVPLWEGLMDSDGSNRRIFTTVSSLLSQQFSELSIKLGYVPHINFNHHISYLNGRKIEGDCYTVVIGSQWRVLAPYMVSKTTHNGKIWCLSVKDNKNFLVERGGVFSFCGNTDEVYGSLAPDDLPSTELTPCRASSPYSASKAAADQLAISYYVTYGLPVTISRCTNNYGPYQMPEKLIPRTISLFTNGERATIHGDGQQIRDWIYVMDHCEAVDCILRKGRLGEVYNVGGANQITNIEVMTIICGYVDAFYNMVHLPFLHHCQFVPDRLGNDRRYNLNITKIQKELGWRPKYDFVQELYNTVRWYLNNSDWMNQMLKRLEEK